ncbi:MAG: MATE family efflux transporter [Desulfovibrio sp.]|nr:MAG: MATE family efflux transporter [Desulfovibrio sp.]
MAETNDLTTGPIPGLIRKVAVPASVGFFFYTMYNVVDTFFAGEISTTAIAALSLAFPVFFIILSVGSGLSVGGTALIANALGEGDKDQARKIAIQGLSFGIIAALVLTIVGLSLAPPLFRLLGASEEYLSICLDYMNVIFCGSVFFLVVYMTNSVLQAQGDTKTFRNFLILGCVLNCGLDPWFIYGGLGVPAMGISGIALATVLIQAVGCCYLLWRACRSGLLSLRYPKEFIPNGRAFLEIAKQGLPAAVNYMTIGLGIFVITYFLSWFGETAVAAYGIATRVEQIVLMPTIGLNIATLSIVAQNNGAGHLDRIRETVLASLKYGALIMSLGTILVFCFAETMMAVFSDDPAVIGAGSDYLRIAAFVLYAYVVLFVITASLQGVKKPMYAIWIGLYRQIAMPMAVMYLLTRVLDVGLDGIWWAIFTITWSAVVVTVAYAAFQWRKISSAHVPAEEAPAVPPE